MFQSSFQNVGTACCCSANFWLSRKLAQLPEFPKAPRGKKNECGERAMSYFPCDSICHESARECVRLARMSDDPEVRCELFELARQWMALAMEEGEAEIAAA